MGETAVRGAIWALIGVIFGFLFVVIAELLADQVGPPYAVPAAIVLAAGLTSLFYGSMRLAVLVANLTFIAIMLFTWQSGGGATLDLLVFLGGGLGLAVGAAYGWYDKGSRVCCADAKTIAGLVAGGVAAMAVAPLALLVADIDGRWLAMIGAPLALLVYVSIARWFIDRCHGLFPPVVDGALVGLGVGVFIGLLCLIIAGALDAALLSEPAQQALVQRVEAAWPGTVFACAAACFPVGVLRSVLGVAWYDL
jgi:hypothetical protein